MRLPAFKTIALGAALLASSASVQAAYPTYEAAAAAAKIQMEKGDFGALQKTAEEELALARTPDQKADALIGLGLSYSQRKMYPQARQQWTKIVDAPEFAESFKFTAYSLLGGSYGEEEQWSLARAEFQKAVALPNATAQQKASIKLVIAGTYFNEKNSVEGRKLFAALIDDAELDINFRALASTQLGQQLNNEKEFELARTAFNQTLSFAKIPLLLRLATHAGIAESYKAQGDETKAQTAFVQAQAHGMGQMTILAKAERYEEARLMAEQTLTLGTIAPTIDAVLQTQIGYFLRSEGKLDEARTRLETFVAKQYGPNLSQSESAIILALRRSAQFSIARIYIIQGNKEQAKKVLQTLLATDAVDPDTKAEAEKVLEEIEEKG